jgi:hypothetical protein
MIALSGASSKVLDEALNRAATIRIMVCLRFRPAILALCDFDALFHAGKHNAEAQANASAGPREHHVERSRFRLEPAETRAALDTWSLKAMRMSHCAADVFETCEGISSRLGVGRAFC